MCRRVGDKPPSTDPEALSFWGARLLFTTSGGGDEGVERGALLTANSTADRLRRVGDGLASRAERMGQCRVM